MDGCNTCWQDRRNQDESLSKMRTLAKQRTEQTGRTVAIIQDGEQMILCDAFEAIEKKYQIKEIVSCL